MHAWFVFLHLIPAALRNINVKTASEKSAKSTRGGKKENSGKKSKKGAGKSKRKRKSKAKDDAEEGDVPRKARNSKKD